jgi:hypothetical protein
MASKKTEYRRQETEYETVGFCYEFCILDSECEVESKGFEGI